MVEVSVSTVSVTFEANVIGVSFTDRSISELDSQWPSNANYKPQNLNMHSENPGNI